MLALASGKGGTGKTTTAIALADALPGTPLVVDADREMPNLHALAHVRREPTLADATDRDTAHRLAGQARDHDCRVLPAPGRDDPPTDRLLTRLAVDRRDAGEEQTRHVLVDCPAGAAPDAVAPLRVAGAVVLVTPVCAAALRDTAKTAAMARTLGTTVVGVVLTRVRFVPDGVRSLLDCPVLGAIPSVPTGGDPLSDRAVKEAYAQAANRLQQDLDVAVGV